MGKGKGKATVQGQSSWDPPPPPGPPPSGTGLSRRVGMIGGGAGSVVCTCGVEAVLLTVRNEQSANRGISGSSSSVVVVVWMFPWLH